MTTETVDLSLANPPVQDASADQDTLPTDPILTMKPRGFDFWKTSLQAARYVVAPMVDQSELAWRALGRKHGAHLCYTPMFHARIFAEDPHYRAQQFQTAPGDRPLIVQFCANDADTLLRAARLVEDHCDAVDINLGCPQGIAKRGHYGSYLQDEWELIADMVRTLHRELKVPVTCKIRVFPDADRTVRYAQMIEAAGCQLLTVHGRTREQKGHHTGLADWTQIKRVVEAVRIPVFANGNILTLADCERCIAETGAVGVMSAEAHLYHPALFSGATPFVWDMVAEYLALCRVHPTPVSFIRSHLFKLFRKCLGEFTDHRTQLGAIRSLDGVVAVAEELCALLKQRHDSLSDSERVALDEKPLMENMYRSSAYIRPDHAINIPDREPSCIEAPADVKRVRLEVSTDE